MDKACGILDRKGVKATRHIGQKRREGHAEQNTRAPVNALVGASAFIVGA